MRSGGTFYRLISLIMASEEAYASLASPMAATWANAIDLNIINTNEMVFTADIGAVTIGDQFDARPVIRSL